MFYLTKIRKCPPKFMDKPTKTDERLFKLERHLFLLSGQQKSKLPERELALSDQ